MGVEEPKKIAWFPPSLDAEARRQTHFRLNRSAAKARSQRWNPQG
jgi:hypothetical protein